MREYIETAYKIKKIKLETKRIKALNFLDKLIQSNRFQKKFKLKYNNINIRVPKIFSIGTDEFDEFMELNNLWEIALHTNSNKKILNKFISSKLPI